MPNFMYDGTFGSLLSPGQDPPGPTPPEFNLSHGTLTHPARVPMSHDWNGQGEIVSTCFEVDGTPLQFDIGMNLDLDDWAGQTVTVKLILKIGENGSIRNASAETSVAVPTWLDVRTLRNDMPTDAQPGGNYQTYLEAIQWMESETGARRKLEIHPHTSGQWLIEGDEYWYLGFRFNQCAIKGVGGTPVVLNGQGTSTPPYGPYLWHCENIDDVTIANLEFRNADRHAIRIALNSQKVLIKDVIFQDTIASGIKIQTDLGDFDLANCESRNAVAGPLGGEDFTANGFFVLSGDGIRFHSCLAEENGQVPPAQINVGGDGFHVTGTSGTVQNVEFNHCQSIKNGRQGFLILNGITNTSIKYCESAENQGSGFQIEYGNAIPGGPKTSIGIIRGCEARDNNAVRAEYGFWLDGCEDWIVERCFAHGNGGGIRIGDIASNVIVRNNIIAGNNGNLIPIAVVDCGSWGLYASEYCEDVKIYNNTFAANGIRRTYEGRALNNGSGIYHDSLNSSGFSFFSNIVSENILNDLGRNNNWHIGLATGYVAVVRWNDNLYWMEPRPDGYRLSAAAPSDIDYNDWKSMTGFDADTLYSDPMLDSSYKPQAGSSAIGAGAPAAVSGTTGDATVIAVDDEKVFRLLDYVEINGEKRAIVGLSPGGITLGASVNVTTGDPIYFCDRHYGVNLDQGADIVLA